MQEKTEEMLELDKDIALMREQASEPCQEDIRDERGRFRPGISGNPAGPGDGYKKKRVAVREQALAALDMLNDKSAAASWLYDLAIKDPRTYAMILSKTMPKDIKLDAKIASEDPKLANVELLARCAAIVEQIKG